MLKNIGKYLGIGFLFGLGFVLAGYIVIFVFEKAVKSNHMPYKQQVDERKTKYLKDLISNIESKGRDLCKDIQGTWVGEFVEEGGAYIRSWELTYNTDGTMEGIFVNKSITEEITEHQKGNWSCYHSILFTDVIVDGDTRRRWNYLLLHSDNNERIYAHIGEHTVENVYRTFRKK